MNKTLIFADAHFARNYDYELLVDVAEREGTDRIVYLGDTDGVDSYRRLIDFRNRITDLGLGLDLIRGNHDQAWLDYIEGDDELFSLLPDYSDVSIKDAADIRGLIQEMALDTIHEDVIYTLLAGKPASGACGPLIEGNDPRLKYPDLWYYTFGTNQTEPHPSAPKKLHLTYDPTVVLATFGALKNRNARYLVKGHEHINKVWQLTDEGTLSGGEFVGINDSVEVPNMGIIQLGAYKNGNYAVLEKINDALRIRFQKIPRRRGYSRAHADNPLEHHLVEPHQSAE